MPYAWRHAVSEAIYWDDFSKTPATHLAMQRAVSLDPANTHAWKRRCRWADTTGDLQQDILICKQATAVEPAPLDYEALGKAELAAGQACEAQKSYARAIAMDDNPTHYTDLEAVAHSAQQCGDLVTVRNALLKAIQTEEQNRAAQRQYSGDDDYVAQRDEANDQALLDQISTAGKAKAPAVNRRIGADR